MSTRTCPKCQGLMLLEPEEYGSVWACLNCGKRISLKEMEVIMTTRHEEEANSTKEPLLAPSSSNQPELAATEPEMAPVAIRRERLAEARKLRGKKCQTCEHSYEHDEQRWCSKKKCPSRIPGNNRLQYRPLPPGEGTPAKVEAFHKVAKVPAKSPSATKVNKSKPSTTKVDKGDHVVPASFQVTIIRLPASSNLPGLPAFNPKWKKEVQLKWLDTYRELARR